MVTYKITFASRGLGVQVSLGSLALLLASTAIASDRSVSTPVTALKYGPTGVKNATGELYAAPAYGNLAVGAHGTFVKMPAGFVSDVHIHTADYYAVVISGVGVNSKPGAKEIQLPVGSYWLQKGGEPHITKCVSPNECIFFLSQPSPFDYLPPKK